MCVFIKPEAEHTQKELSWRKHQRCASAKLCVACFCLLTFFYETAHFLFEQHLPPIKKRNESDELKVCTDEIQLFAAFQSHFSGNGSLVYFLTGSQLIKNKSSKHHGFLFGDRSLISEKRD